MHVCVCVRARVHKDARTLYLLNLEYHHLVNIKTSTKTAPVPMINTQVSQPVLRSVSAF